MNIAILEDEFSLRNNVKEFLELNNYKVEAFSDGNQFLKECKFNADLYVLDINVPGANGFEVIEWVSNNSPKAPVIFITAYTDIESITKAYKLGCSDYLKKPFDLKELLFRISNLLKESNTNFINITPECVFDKETKQVHKNGKLIKLSKTQKNILSVLLEEKNNLVTYDLLIDYVWGDKYVKNNTIASNIREIRHSLPELVIKSVRAEGYTLEL